MSANVLALEASATSATRIAFVLDDTALASVLRRRVLTRLDLREDDISPAVIVADHPVTSAGCPVLIVGSDRRPGPGESVIRSLDPSVVLSAAALVAAGHRIEPSASQTDDDGTSPLSMRERQVAALLVEGASNKVIARSLGISVHTAKFHVAAVLTKLRARNRADAVAIVLRDGLVVV